MLTPKSRILIVDDVSRNLELLGEILRSDEREILAANQGERALLLAKNTLPDLILLDVMMPGMDGFKVCRQLKADPATAQIPIIFITSKNEQEDIVKGFNEGAVDYIVKPFFREELIVRINTHLSLAIANRRLRRFIEIVDRHVITCNLELDFKLSRVSEALCKISGYLPEEMIGKKACDFWVKNNAKVNPQELRDILRSATTWQGELRFRTKNGNELCWETQIETVAGPDGHPLGFQAIHTDITDKKRIEVLSITDQLTGLYNRFRINETLKTNLDLAQRYETPFSVVILDIDDFKQVNDKHGHLEGDEVLKGLATILQDNVRRVDTVGRWGGEEFLLVLPETDLGAVTTTAEKIRLAVEQSNFGLVGKITCSFGVATYQPDEEIESLLQRADGFLYAAKQQGKNCVVSAEEKEEIENNK